jgi:ABC-type proline/glycine betaine transport system ATPase subunit
MYLEEYGKVVVGYQGIGKSTLAFHNNRVIDLESSNFFVDGERPANWHIIYCNIARALCKQGYIVCRGERALSLRTVLFSDKRN